MILKRLTTLRFPLIILLSGWLSSCGSLEKNVPGIVATVDNRNITRQEFAMAYEYAPRNTTQIGRERAYNTIINGIIDRVLLAAEGRSKGYDLDPAINRIVDFYKRAAVVRELFLKHVRDSVNISEDELRLAYRKMKTTLYLKNYIFNNLYEIEMFLNGSLDIAPTPMTTDGKSAQHDIYGYIDIIQWNDLEQEVEDILFQLAVNEFSDPYFDGHRYHIFKIVDKVFDTLLTENDFYSKRLTLQKVIRRRKEHALAFSYVQRIMNPQNMIIKSKTLNQLSDLFWESQQLSENIIHFPTVKEITELTSDNTNILSAPIATFHAGDWTVEDFLFNYELKPVEIQYHSKNSVKAGLVNAIAILIRDYVLSEQGIQEGLEDRPAVIQEVQYWTELLLANKVKRNLYTGVLEQLPDTAEREKIFDYQLSALLSDLRKNSQVVVDSTALYAVATSDRGLSRKIDFVSTLLE